MGSNGKRIRSQALLDPQTGNGVREWSRACELVRDMEARAPTIAPIIRTIIGDAIEHFLKLKAGKAPTPTARAKGSSASFARSWKLRRALINASPTSGSWM